MGGLVVLRIAIVLSGAGLALAEQTPAVARSGLSQESRWLLTGLAAANIGLLCFLLGHHIDFPFFLESMEGTVLQHFHRALAGQPIYPAPTADFVALAYNPLYYFVAIPFSWILGDGLVTLRSVSILATALCGLILFDTLRRRTNSAWWGLMAAGLFAGAYRALDAYLDSAHADASFLCAALGGAWLIDRRGSRAQDGLGIVLFCAAFWFKQHGVLFLVGGLTYLAWRDGLRAAAPHWALGIALGPIAYGVAGPALFGSHFHYFTWWVPLSWSEPGIQGVARWANHLITAYPILLTAALLLYGAKLFARSHLRDDVFVFLLPVALATGLMGSLDTGSSSNVYIPMGTWLILTGVLGLYGPPRWEFIRRWRLDRLALIASFALLVYDPRALLLSPRAHESYADLVAEIESLDGPVYMPWDSHLPSGVTSFPAASYIALADMIRGRSDAARASLELRRLLAELTDRDAPAYILTHTPLRASDPVLGFAFSHYREAADYGNRFAALTGLDHRWRASFPRFLYRLDSAREP